MSTASPAAAKITAIFPSARDLLHLSWETFKKLWKKFVAIGVLVPLIPIGILVVILLVYAIMAALIPSGAARQLISILLGLLGLVDVLALVYIAVSCFYASFFIIKDNNLSIKDAFNQSRAYFWRYIWLCIILCIVLAVGFIFLIVPGLIFSIWFSLALYILIFEGIGGIKALKQSRNLVRGFWWTVFARFLTIYLISTAIGAIFNLLAQPAIVAANGIIKAGFSPAALGSIALILIYGVVIWIISAVINYIIAMVTTIYGVEVYKNLKSIKDKDTGTVDNMPALKKIGWLLLGLIVFPILIGLAHTGQKLNPLKEKNLSEQLLEQNLEQNILK